MDRVIIKIPHGYYEGGVFPLDYMPTLDTGIGNWHTLIGERKMECNQIGQIKGNGFNEMTGRVYSTDGLSPSIRTFSGGNTEIKIAEEKEDVSGSILAPCNFAHNAGYTQASFVKEEPIMQTTRGRDVVGTIRASYHKQGERNLMKNILEGQGYEGIIEPQEIQNYRVRKLTPKECFRLQGVKDEDFEKVKNQSDSSLYHLAGDSICSVCLVAIFGQLLGVDWQKTIKEIQNGVMEKPKN